MKASGDLGLCEGPGLHVPFVGQGRPDQGVHEVSAEQVSMLCRLERETRVLQG